MAVGGGHGSGRGRLFVVDAVALDERDGLLERVRVRVVEHDRIPLDVGLVRLVANDLEILGRVDVADERAKVLERRLGGHAARGRHRAVGDHLHDVVAVGAQSAQLDLGHVERLVRDHIGRLRLEPVLERVGDEHARRRLGRERHAVPAHRDARRLELVELDRDLALT